MQLKGKTILITGGRRVGAQLAVELARRGANVALSYFKSRERIESVAAEVRQLGVRAAAIAADLRVVTCAVPCWAGGTIRREGCLF